MKNVIVAAVLATLSVTSALACGGAGGGAVPASIIVGTTSTGR